MSMEIVFLNILQQLHTPLLDNIMIFFTRLGNNGILWFLLTILFLLIPKTRKLGIIMGIALIIEALICNMVLKPLVARIRPCDVNTAVKLLINHPKDYSFPSGHTGAAITAVTVLFLTHKKKMAWCALLVGILIAFSRMYLYVHYPTDVLGGAILGIISGWIAVKLTKDSPYFRGENVLKNERRNVSTNS